MTDATGSNVRNLIQQTFASQNPTDNHAVSPCPGAGPAAANAETRVVGGGGGQAGSKGPNPVVDWIEIVLVDAAGQPAAGTQWRVTMASGVVYSGALGKTGRVRLDGIDPGTATITFPDLDKRLWGPDGRGKSG